MHKIFFLIIAILSSFSCSGANRPKPETDREKKIRYNQNMLHIKQALYTGEINQSIYDSLLIRVNKNQKINFDKALNK
ncbi:MAG: hypothetical protein CMG04_10530 [Candidatus Marinimicrobia bacterium]|nr:hypothetical protein [Candidatus Neomarinimicrobiota bacterium]